MLKKLACKCFDRLKGSGEVPSSAAFAAPSLEVSLPSEALLPHFYSAIEGADFYTFC
jgi:hypothetical protein